MGAGEIRRPANDGKIQSAVRDLYGTYDVIAPDVQGFIEKAIQDGGYESMYTRVREAEAKNRENLLEYQEEKPGVITGDNVSDVIAALRRRKAYRGD